MLCQACKKREALVHLSTGTTLSRNTKHFCKQCADAYFARTPEMNSARELIRLSNFYRSRLYDLLEEQHPEAFDNSTADACRKGSDLMRRFLRKHLSEDNIKLNKDAFEMLCLDFFASRHFYDRAAKYETKTKPSRTSASRGKRTL